MAVLDVDVVPFHDGIEIVARHFRIERARQPHGAQVGAAPGRAHQRELAPDEAIVEAHVVRHEHAALEPLAQFTRHLLERWRVGQHVVVDAGERGDAGRNAHARIHQALPFEVDSVARRADDGDVDDAMHARRAAGRLDVDEGYG